MTLLKKVFVLFCGICFTTAIIGIYNNYSTKNLTNIPSDLQINDNGNIVIIEKPEQFYAIDKQIAPNTKGNTIRKSPAHVQLSLDLAAIEAKKAHKKLNRMPLFLFKDSVSKIQSNTRDIQNDTYKNSFPKRNIQPATILSENQDKADNSQDTPKQKSRQMSSKSFPVPMPHNDDIVLEDDSTPVERSLNRYRRAVTARKERLWDYAVVPYEIDKIFKEKHKALFKEAMRHWENSTCIKFVERDKRLHPNYIFFTITSCICCSNVGKEGKGRQNISIGRNCDKMGIVLHELGHAIGFVHEHNREDRDEHVVINYSNIMPGQKYNFNTMGPEDVESLGLPYDYKSIMHYSRKTFSKSIHLDTIRPLKARGNENIEIGQRLKLSEGDIVQANLLYKCFTCGRTLLESSGKIVSPHYNLKGQGGNDLYDEIKGSGNGSDSENESDNNLYTDFDKSLESCEWHITATHGERIILQLHQVNLYSSTDCKEDYLEIRNGYWRKAPVVKRLCGNHTSLTIKSDTGHMLITYVNRRSMKGFSGFTADYEVTCSGDIFLSEDRRIDSPNHPLQYHPDKECVWRITAPDNHQVGLRFHSFELENHDICVYDYVEIRDGNSSDSKLIGRFCGYKLPPNIKTNSNQMYLKFVSDGSVQKVGFSAVLLPIMDKCKLENHGCEHECINTPGSYHCRCFAGYELEANGRTCANACGGIIDASMGTGVVNSPSWPDAYPRSKECIWEIVAPANHAVFLNFTHFDLEGISFEYSECDADYLAIYSKLRDNRLKKIGIYCGSEIPPTIKSEHNILRLIFSSDDSEQRTGFSAKFEIDSDECSIGNGGCQHYCNNNFGSYVCSCRNGYTLHENRHNCTETKCKFEITNSYGEVTSPNYPDDYPRNIYCYWRFHTVLGHRLVLTFQDFQLEKHQECIYDHVSVHDGKSENSSTLGTYCGGREPYIVVGSFNDMFMVLRTDAGLQRKGFRATYSTACGGYLRATNQSRIFYSHPRYGMKPYKRNMYCNWRIQADDESSVKIKFLHFEIEYSEKCDYDFVEITEEQSVIRNHGKYCGNKRPPTIISYTDTILLSFKTDESTSLKGFAVSFVAVEPPDDYDVMPVTAFPGSMKSIYVSSDAVSEIDYDDDDNDDNDYYDDTDENDTP